MADQFSTQQQSLQTPPRKRRGGGFWLIILIAVVAVVGTWMWSNSMFDKKIKLAIVTAGDNPAYWDAVLAGAQKAADERNVELTVVKSKPDVDTQSAHILDLRGKKFDGVAISPINPRAEAALLGGVAAESTLVTFDSDSPVSRRLCFVGTDNYAAGRLVGEQVRAAVADGGDILVCVGNPEKENSKHRRQGLIDELLDRSFLPERPIDPMDQPLKGEKYSVIATVSDNADPKTTGALVTEALKAHPSIKCVVACLGYQTPAILEAMGSNDAIKLIGFDCSEETLKAIDSGRVAATMQQDQYGIGYQAVRILSDDLKGNRGGLPMFQTYPLACQPVTKANVAAVRTQIASGAPMLLNVAAVSTAEQKVLDAASQPTAPATQPTASN